MADTFADSIGGERGAAARRYPADVVTIETILLLDDIADATKEGEWIDVKNAFAITVTIEDKLSTSWGTSGRASIQGSNRDEVADITQDGANVKTGMKLKDVYQMNHGGGGGNNPVPNFIRGAVTTAGAASSGAIMRAKIYRYGPRTIDKALPR